MKQFEDFHKEIVYSGISCILQASSPLHWESSTHISTGAPSSADTAQNPLNLFPDGFSSSKKQKELYCSLGFSAVRGYYQALTLHATNTAAKFPWDHSSSPAFSNSKELHLRKWRAPWKRFCGWVFTSRDHLCWAWVHIHPHWVSIPHGPGHTGNTVQHTGNKNISKASHQRHMHQLLGAHTSGFPCSLFILYQNQSVKDTWSEWQYNLLNHDHKTIPSSFILFTYPYDTLKRETL